MAPTRQLDFGTRAFPFAYRTALPLRQLEPARNRLAYAGDAYCKVVRATGDLTGAIALRLSGVPSSSLKHLSLVEQRTLLVHRVGSLVGQGLGCLLGLAIGTATWLNPTANAAFDVAASSTVTEASRRVEADLVEEDGSWVDSLNYWVDLTVLPNLSHRERVARAYEDVIDQVSARARDTRDGYTELGVAAVGLVLTERALSRILEQGGSPAEQAMREALHMAQHHCSSMARYHAIVSCRGGNADAALSYGNDNPTLLRIKHALLALSAPVVASVNVLLTMGHRGALAAHAACVQGDLRGALVHTAWGLSAPLLGVGLQLTALGGVLAPNLGRQLYARVEAPMTWTMAPCFIPHQPPRGAIAAVARALGLAPEAERHGLGGLALEGGRI